MDKNKELKSTSTKAAETTKATETVTDKKAAEPKAEAKTTAKIETKADAKKTTATKTTKTAAKTTKTTTKTTAAKTTATKTTAKKSTAKKAEISTSVAVQFSGKEVFTDNLIEEVKKEWVEKFEGKLSEIKTIELYIKPEERKVYFVINGLSNGNYFINL